jgi:hypothetical protein
MPTAGWQAERVMRIGALASQAEHGLDSKAISILLVTELENSPAHLTSLSRHTSECACIKGVPPRGEYLLLGTPSNGYLPICWHPPSDPIRPATIAGHNPF